MTIYEKWRQELEESSRASETKKELLGPLPFDHAEDLLEALPPKKNYIGPRAWYKLIQRLRKRGT